MQTYFCLAFAFCLCKVFKYLSLTFALFTCYTFIILKLIKENSLHCFYFNKIINIESMQEIFQAQKVTFVYPAILTLEVQKQKLKCSYNRPAYYVCINPECEASGLMCMELTCQCRESHYKCYHIQLKRVLQSINNHQQNIPEEVRKSYKQVYNIINELIDQLSKLRTKVNLEQTYFGLTQQEIEFMKLIDKQEIGSICGKVVSSLETYFQTNINFTIDKQAQIYKDFQQKRKEFDQLFNYIKANYTKYQTGTKRQQIKQLFCDSNIVTKMSQIRLIHQWLQEDNENCKLSSKLLFRASQHNFKANEFHKYCDGIQNTFVIVKSQFNKVFGGFTPKKWATVNQQKNHFVNDQTGKSFLFSVSMKQKYKCIDPQKSINNFYNVGPAFGGGCDFAIKDNCNIDRTSFAKFPVSYSLPLKEKNMKKQTQNLYNFYNNKQYQNQQRCVQFSGSKKDTFFRVQQYEVYQIQKNK